MHSDWRDWKNTNQRWSQFRVKKRNYILYEPLTLSAKPLLPSLLMWIRNHRDPPLQHWKKAIMGSWRGLDPWYCATIVVRKGIFISIAHTCWRTMPTRYRLLKHQTLTLLLNIQKTWRDFSDLKCQKAVI